MMTGSLTAQVFNCGYKSIPNPPGWTSEQQATWPATTSTLIAGEQDALLVDALFTTAEGDRLARWVQDSGKELSTIYVTHGHGDHFFGAGRVLEAFPRARLVTLPEVVDEAAVQNSDAAMELWDSWFHDQFDKPALAPSPLSSNELQIEGHLVRMLALGGGDGVTNTVVHVPELETVVSGDVAYNNIHMWLVGSTAESRAQWLAALDALAALRPGKIITGHKDPDAPDDDAGRVLDQSRHYVEDFDRAVARSASASEVIGTMMEGYSAYGNPFTLVAAATAQFDNQ
jgi:glyoxylase-like metal-dependent hydrolase (beta-lactamase superfamily II)